VYDPEATIQDADILMAQYAEEARQLEAQRARGICQHSSAVGYAVNPATGKVYYPEQEGLLPGQQRCTEGCGRVFADDAEYFRAVEDALYG
jgi:hypothetical protein